MQSARRPPRKPSLFGIAAEFTGETDSAAEGTGFEPSVPLKDDPVSLAEGEEPERSNRAVPKTVLPPTGTEGSNPSSSASESSRRSKRPSALCSVSTMRPGIDS